MTRKRQPLDDTFAEEFVYGESKPKDESSRFEKQPTTEIESAPKRSQPKTKKVKSVSSTTKKKNEELSLMDKLQTVEAKEATKRFTVDLAESLHRKLSILSAKTGRSKADIVRLLLEDALQDIE